MGFCIDPAAGVHFYTDPMRLQGPLVHLGAMPAQGTPSIRSTQQTELHGPRNLAGASTGDQPATSDSKE